MDTAVQNEISVWVREEPYEMWNAEPEERALYAGIFNVRLNRTVQITFVPGFERNPTNWPPKLPPVDTATYPTTNMQQARLLTAALEDYTVTVGMGNEVQTLPFLLPGFDDVPPHQGTLFLVTQEEYTVFEHELADVEQTLSGIHSSRPLSELQDKSFVQYLQSRVICSPHFRKQDARTLENRALLMK